MYSPEYLKELFDNILFDADSYKHSHPTQYPKDTHYVESYIESRGGKYDATIFFGLQMFLKRYLCLQITQQMIDMAEPFINEHFGGQKIFYREGWEYIVKHHNGYLPLRICAVPEGLLIPTSNVLVTIRNTDPEGCAWLTSWVETQLLRGVWYPTTVATNSFMMKQVIKKYLNMTGDPTLIDYKLHDFGGRGVTCKEQANIGGASHLVNFKGTDTLSCIPYAMYYYNTGEMLAHSIPASEHTTIITWGKDGELDAMRNMVKQFGKPGATFACVSDTNDIYNACTRLWGTDLRKDIEHSGSTLVVRPDSGDPVDVTLRCVEILGEKFGFSINRKGYKVLKPCVRLIQGDGIDFDMIGKILANFAKHSWSADNLAFGSGGGLLQKVDRDLQKFAQKASAAEVGGEWREIFKNPITDPGKKSKKGRLGLFRSTVNGEYATFRTDNLSDMNYVEQFYYKSVLVPVFENGKVLREYSFAEVRANSEK